MTAVAFHLDDFLQADVPQRPLKPSRFHRTKSFSMLKTDFIPSAVTAFREKVPRRWRARPCAGFRSLAVITAILIPDNDG